ncbi:hypothetical protein [Paenisporosarcina cavernae]|uniref:Hemolysin XhlA n=1 Tax=Paenisporosarcina cavernae TaxID=2320858 RepID=A0A385YSK8_9BACL|nr:hypothetical protein [Paenisporosarcina cavernae]AYC29636.1 hypothetical protein D3873_06945 [Paenisporosarcina cavernae]AYC30000.1 hypothetical protein D3873_08995 [Paenisporosarcina cavernae]
MTVQETTQSTAIHEMTKSVNALNVNFARVEGKIDSALELKKDVGSLGEKIDLTDDIAKKALNCAENLDKQLNEFKTSMKWSIGIIFSIITPLGLFILSQVIN